MKLTPSAAYTLEDQDRMTRAKNYFAWQRSLIARELGRRVIEIGCGIGNFTSLILESSEAVLAVDIEPDCVERLMRRFPDQSNLHAIVGDLNGPSFPDLSTFRADSCVCLNVLEHIEDDREALRRMSAALVPGGVIILIVPAFPGLYGPIDHLLGHYRRYTRASFSNLAGQVGLRVKTSHYLNVVGFLGWWANAHILKREAQSESQIEFFDRFVVPIASKLEGWVHPPFGQSLFVILEKQKSTR